MIVGGFRQDRRSLKTHCTIVLLYSVQHPLHIGALARAFFALNIGPSHRVGPSWCEWPGPRTSRMQEHSNENSTTVLLTLMFTTLPPITFLVFAYVITSDVVFSIFAFLGRRVNSNLRFIWRTTWVGCNVAVFGSVIFYMLRECIAPVGSVDAVCNRSRPLASPPCLVLACATCVAMLLVLFLDRVVCPFLKTEKNEKETSVYYRGRVQRIGWGGSLIVAWAAISDMDSSGLLVLFGLALRRTLEPILPTSLLRPLLIAYKSLILWIMARTLSHTCTLLVPRLAVGSVLAVLLW